MENTISSENRFSTICKGIALAMGVAAIVLNILGTVQSPTDFTILAIGLTALALAMLVKKTSR